MRTCIEKFGTITPMHLQGDTDPVLIMSNLVPIESTISDSAFAGKGIYQNVTFQGFNLERTYCGGDSMVAITLNPGGSDIIPPVDFIECTFIDVEDEGFVYMFEPPESWVSVRECGSFPCTGPLNTAFTFSRTNYEGS